MITIRLENNEEADESWAIRKSKLIKWSGWFRRMFNHDWIVSVAKVTLSFVLQANKHCRRRAQIK